MSNQPSKSKGSSRWGSLLSGAVAGLESRLDTFFEEGQPQNGQPPPKASGASQDGLSRDGARFAPQTLESGLSRPATPSSLPPPQNNTISSLSAALRTTSSSRTSLDGTPRTSHESARPPTRSSKLSTLPLTEHAADSSGDADEPNAEQIESGDRPDLASAEEPDTSETIPTFGDPDVSDLDQSTPAGPGDPDTVSKNESYPQAAVETGSLEEYRVRITQLQEANEAAELQRQEEVHLYLERLDALEAKLQYLTKEATETAQKDVADPTADPLQKKLAAKDEQIALLMVEGQKLSKAEVTQAGAARKLRAKAVEDANVIADLRKKLGTAERSSEDLLARIRRLDSNQRDAITRLSRIPQLERELKAAAASRDEYLSTTHVLRNQLEAETKKVQDAQVKANSAALEQQQLIVQSLQDDLANAKIEKQLCEDRLRNDVKQAKEELEREKERGRGAELQLRNEINTLENRLESLRARTEEASTATTGDSRAKLMRQIEIMQSQYTLASENWQGIESSLQARLSAAEKERNDTARAETEARKRARDSGNNVRRLQEQLEESSRKCALFEQELGERQNHASKLETRLLDFERTIRDANANLERERSAWDLKLASRIEEEKAKWRQEAIYQAPEPPMQPESPAMSRKQSGFDFPTMSSRRGIARQFSSAELSAPYISDRRRSHNRRNDPLSPISPSGPDSGRSTPAQSAPGLNGKGHTAPSIYTVEADDDNFDNDSSPHRTVNDMLSVSTAAAGPSVQLVERMSAAVRRLESEKAATQDELSRLAVQRDEARKEVVALMAEADQKRKLEARLKKSEQDQIKVEQRYQTTLELLGEKSERVDELEHDIQDLKKIYRELADTMK